MTFIATSLKKIDTGLLFIDTDSLRYDIKSEDVYKEFFKHKHLFDFSNYPKDSTFFDKTNNKVIGKMKDESKRKIISEFVGLRSRKYSKKNIDGKKYNMAKGVNIATEFNEFKGTFSSIVNEAIKTISSQFIIFLWKDFERTKT